VNSVVIATVTIPVGVPIVVPAIIFVIVIGTAAVVPVAVIAARTDGIHLDKVSVVVDVNMITHAAFAGVEAVRQARSFEADVIVAAPV
jgi:hypothetical protein